MLAVELIGGLVLLLVGGDLLVRGAVSTARHFAVSPLLIGLTVVGFGTSTPELVTSVQAAMVGSPGIAVGNVVGSNIANILLILGISALILPVAVDPKAFRRDGSVLALSTIACAIVVLAGFLSRPAGIVFVLALVGYVVFTYLKEKRSPDESAALHEAESEAAPSVKGGIALSIVLTVAGLALTLLGAKFLVSGAVELAKSVGMTETVIGLTIVAVGTSMPELITSITAAIRKQGDVALGNIVGSNIYNVLGILGATAIIQPIPVPPEIASFDLWVLIATTALLLVFATTGRQVSRWEGGVFLAGYVAYVGWLLTTTTGA